MKIQEENRNKRITIFFFDFIFILLKCRNLCKPLIGTSGYRVFPNKQRYTIWSLVGISFILQLLNFAVLLPVFSIPGEWEFRDRDVPMPGSRNRKPYKEAL